MHEVTVTTMRALSFIMLAASRLPEGRHRRVLGLDQDAVVELVCESIFRLFGVCHGGEAHIDVTIHVITQVFHHNEFLDRAVGLHPVENVLDKVLEPLFIVFSWDALVQVWNRNRVGNRRLDVSSRTPVSVSTRTNFQVERAVDFIILGSIEPRELVCHGCLLAVSTCFSPGGRWM